MSTSKLIIVPTPIGNLKDITYRAIEILENVDLIIAEDTRVTKRLLDRYNILKPLTSFHAANEHKKVNHIIGLLLQGQQLALVSDAGTPGISDPGYLLIKRCIEDDIEIEVLPGPNAFVPALLKSGFPSDSFIFEGFLPHKKGRIKKIQQWINEDRTVILYESPHRILKLLQQLDEVLEDNREISISRELTKIYEETVNGNAKTLIEYFESKPPKGEFVVVIKGQIN